MRFRYKLLIVLGVLALLTSHPMTRGIVFWLLPLGSGFDDLVQIVLVIGFFIWLLANGAVHWKTFVRKVREG